MKLASFDIFDTVLIRKCGAPENIFHLLARRLYPDDRALRDDFLVWRRHVAARLSAARQGAEVTLAEIYASADLPGYTRDELSAAELAVESENLVANPRMRDEIERCRQAGCTIIFLSDMYLPSSFLAEVLSRECCRLPDERIYVSCEHHARKDRGALYELVRSTLHPRKWIHYGDNRRSDIRMARRHGVMAKWVDTAYTAAERKILAHAKLQREPHQLSILAGMSRAARLLEGNTPEAILAADFVAPCYIPYVLFVLREARARGVRKLYFVSRDGYILRKAAEALLPDMELRDLFISRRSLILPYLADDFSEAAYLRIVDRHTLLRRRVSHMLWQLNTNKEEAAKSGAVFDYEVIRTRAQERDFLDKLFRSAFAEELKRRATEARELTLAYLRQERVAGKEGALLVDVGWLGSSRLMLNSLLSHAGCAPAEFLYYGIRGDVFPCSDGRYLSYFQEGNLSTECTVLVENYFSQSPNPSTCGYRREGERIVPEWADGRDCRMTPTIRLHTRVLTAAADALRGANLPEEILYSWAKLSIDEAIKFTPEVDYAPLAVCGDFDDRNFVRRLTAAEVLKIAIGKKVTALDTASLQLTLGFHGRCLIEYLHFLSLKFLYPIYKRL